jgi:hypothetical protein
MICTTSLILDLPMQQPYRLGSLLIKKNIISQQQLDVALSHQRQNSGMQLGKVLVNLEFVTDKQISKTLHKQNRIRLYAAAIAFVMAPFQVCNASQEIESLPEYSYTQVADQQYGQEAFDDFSVDIRKQFSLDLLEVTTAAAWYLYKGGLTNSKFNEMPVKVKLASTDKVSYTVNLSINF